MNLPSRHFTALSCPRKLAPTLAFTLVELSIVLVIIGLIIGGILVGKELITAAELKKFYSEKEKLILSMNTFRLKYNCLAGDCATATNFFGADPELCDGSTPEKTPKTETCNGDGNGIIDTEAMLVPQHLNAANLWPGLFRGSDAPGGLYDETVFQQISVRKQSVWMFYPVSAINSVPLMLNEPLGKDNLIITLSLSGGAAAPGGPLTPIDAQTIDTKYDDGKPASGTIQAMNDSFSLNCTDPATAPAPTAIYDLTQIAGGCAIFFNDL